MLMLARLIQLPVTWTQLKVKNADSAAKISKRLESVLSSWENTPYNSRHATKGVGVYCTAFVAGVLDELFRRSVPTPLNVIPHDVSLHSGPAARKGLRWFLRHYPTAQRIWSATASDSPTVDVEPGDILITGPVGGGPGHAMMIGPRKNTVWQAFGQSVHYTGLAVPEGNLLYAVYRFTDKEAWL
jgi:hypothetical protein